MREATLHPCPQGILGVELSGLLPLAGSLDGLVVGLGPDGELPWGVFRRGARTTGGTRATGGPVKPDANDRIARDIVSRPPVDTRMPLGTVGLLRLAIQYKGLQVIALTGLKWGLGGYLLLVHTCCIPGYQRLSADPPREGFVPGPGLSV